MSPGGIPIYYYDRVTQRNELSEAILFTGLINAIQNFMIATNVGEPEQFSTKTSEVYLRSTACFSVALLKDLADGVSQETIKELLNELTLKIFDIIGSEEACNVLDEEQAEMIRDITELVISDWEERLE